MQSASINESCYYLLFKDFSHYRTIYFLKSKDETLERIKNFIALTINKTGKKLKILRTDNGLKFVNSGVQELKEHGIRHQRTVAYTPEQNGSAERENRTIVEAARAMIHSKNLPLKLWAEAANMAVHVLNRAGKSTVEGKTPYELWSGKTTKLEKLVIFGATTYVHVLKEKRRKLDSKAVKGYFVGYGKDIKGFRTWFPDKDKIETQRDVIFKEDDHLLEIPDKSEQNEPVQIFVFPKDKIHEQMAEQPTLLEESEESDDDGRSEDENGWSSADEILAPQRQEPRLEEQVMEIPQARVLRNRETIKRPSRYQDGIDSNTVFIALGRRVTKRQFTVPMQTNGSDGWRNRIAKEEQYLEDS